MTPNEITTVLASGFDKTFDVPFKLMLMKRVDMWRARHIKNTLDKAPQDRKFFRSTIYLNLTETTEVPCALPYTGCKVYVSSVLPEPLRANSILFDYFGAVNGGFAFTEVPPGFAPYRKGRYTKKMVLFTYSDKRVYVMEKVPMARLDFISAWPEELENFSCNAEGTTCDYWNSEYPCPPEVLQLILQSIREIDFKQDPSMKELSIPVDPVNDTAQ